MIRTARHMKITAFFMPASALWIRAVRIPSIWLGLVGLALAAPADPGESAVVFLEKIRSGNLNLEPGGDTSLSPATSPRKRQEISRRLERLRRDLGSEVLAIGPVRRESDLAAVLIRKSGGFDPARLRVIPVAMVRRGESWLAAPLPASFENSGLGYAPELRRQMASLESWMIRQQVIELDRMRQQSADQLRQRLGTSISAGEIGKLSPDRMGPRFLKACAEHRLPEILALLGGLSAELPDQWPAILNAAETALRSPADATRSWRFLTSPEVIRVPLFHDEVEDEATLSVACLDPAGTPRKPSSPAIEIIHLPMRRSDDGSWRIENPPDPYGDGDPDERLLDMFPAKFALLHPASPAESATAIRDAVISAIQSADPTAWAALIHSTGDPKDRNTACLRAAGIWWETRNPATAIRPLAIDFLETETLAAAACQFFNPRQPDRSDIRFLIFGKTPAGWLWTPAPPETAVDEVRKWSAPRLNGWRGAWQVQLLAECTVLDRIEEGNAPDPGLTAALMKNWLGALKHGDPAAAMRLTARLGHPDSPAQVLRNLSYELSASRRPGTLPEFLSAISGKRLSAASTRSSSDGKPSFPLYPIVNTAEGPRILLEIDLIQSSNRGREFLNRTAIDRLKKQDPDAAEELAGHFEKHRENTSDEPAR